MNKLALLAAVALGTTALCSPAFAATQVNGVAGCITNENIMVVQTGGSGSDGSAAGVNNQDYKCGSVNDIGGTGSAGMTVGNWVTADELNPILSDIYTQLRPSEPTGQSAKTSEGKSLILTIRTTL